MSQGIGSNYNDYSTNQVNQGENLQTTGKTSTGKIVQQKFQEATSLNKVYSSNLQKNLTDKTKSSFHNKIVNFFNKGRKKALDNLNQAYQRTNTKNADAFLKLLKNLSQTSEFKSLPKSTQKAAIEYAKNTWGIDIDPKNRTHKERIQ